MEQKILVLAYPGSGKTFLADNYENVSDFEFQHYRYDYGSHKHLPLEQLKGRTEIRTNNTEWPQNFFNALDEELQKGRIVLVPFATSLLKRLDYLEKSSDVRIIFAIQLLVTLLVQSKFITSLFNLPGKELYKFFNQILTIKYQNL